MQYNRKRVFVSFDFDNDRPLKDFIIQQARREDSPFEICNWSLEEAAPEASWVKDARYRISQCHVVIVMVGRRTHKAQGVCKEVRIARMMGKKVVQIIGYSDGKYIPVPGAGKLYRWNWDNLKTILGG